MWYQLTILRPLADHHTLDVDADYWLRNVNIPLAPFFIIFESVTADPRYIGNDAYLRSRLYDYTERRLFNMISRDELSDGNAVCDSTNNTPNLIESGNVMLEVHMRASPSIEYGRLRMTLFDPSLAQKPIVETHHDQNS